jgi:hypothetical protein
MASADPTLEPYCITEGFLKPAQRIQQRCTRLFSGQPTTLLAGVPHAMLRRDDKSTFLVDFPSPALKACLAATESALAAVKSEREEAAKRLETAKVKHRDLLNSQVGYSRLARNATHRDPFKAATRNPPSGRADYVLVPPQRGFAAAGRRSG